jgi:hypothetical protein
MLLPNRLTCPRCKGRGWFLRIVPNVCWAGLLPFKLVKVKCKKDYAAQWPTLRPKPPGGSGGVHKQLRDEWHDDHPPMQTSINVNRAQEVARVAGHPNAPHTPPVFHTQQELDSWYAKHGLHPFDLPISPPPPPKKPIPPEIVIIRDGEHNPRCPKCRSKKRLQDKYCKKCAAQPDLDMEPTIERFGTPV